MTPVRSRFAEWIAFLILVGLGLMCFGHARAQDANGKFGTRLCCLPVTVTTAWTGTTIAGLKDQTSGSACSGTSFSTVFVKNTHATATAWICLNAAASCPATTNMYPVPALTAVELNTTGVVTSSGTPFTSVSLQGSGAGTTTLLCGYVR